jgi:flagellar basal body-associated protein FliL
MSEPENSMSAEPGRVRVRTPGKHIVLFSLAVTFMIGVSTLMLSRADLGLPAQPFAPATKLVEETFVTDLAADAQGRLRLLKLTIEINAADEAARKALDERNAAMRERLAFFLRELTPEDLDGTVAQERLKVELKRRVDLSLAPAAVSAVTIKSIIVQ